jgi:predicted branched-subunit amino acid permease
MSAAMFERALFGTQAQVARARRAALLAGLRVVAPARVALAAWGLVTGVAMVKTGLTQVQALGMTLLLFAGSAQLAALPLIAADAPIWVVLLTAAVVNLRFVIFSAGLYPYFRHLPLARRIALGYVTGDVSFALAVSRWSAQPGPPVGSTERVWFYIGICSGTWIVWQASSIAGILLGSQVPGTWGLDFVAILALVALVLPMITSTPALAGAVVAGVVAVLAAGVPLKLGLVLAVIAGISAAMTVDVLLESEKKSS